jgi:hypothetical protein
MTTVTFYVNQINVVPSLNGNVNVVKQVFWTALFELDGEKAVVPGEAFLADPDPASFIAIDSLTDQQVLDWVIASHGGQPWLDELTAFQTEMLSMANLRKQVVTWQTPLLDPKPWDQSYANQIAVTVA